MATVSPAKRPPGCELACERFDAAIEDALADRPERYPHGAMFVGADLPGLGKALACDIREGHPIVLVYPDGVERIIESREPPSASAA